MKTIDRRVFDTCYELWSARCSLLETRRRLKRYTYGDQWGDKVTLPDGTTMAESEWIKRSGRRPITNNLIRRLVKTIIGRYRDMATRNRWYDDTDGDVNMLLSLEELDSRLLEEFLISGMAIQRVADDNPLTANMSDVVNVNPEAFFCNDFRDPRGRDIETLGMLHDMTPAEALMRFGNAETSDVDNDDSALALRDLLNGVGPGQMPVPIAAMEFFTPMPGRVRVVEAWTREFDMTGRLSWRVRWFTPRGSLLATYTSPWQHGTHPFVVKYYPLTDGEVHSFVEDVIDQQRYINRIIVLIDRILATSSKGVLLFPLHQKPQNKTWHDIARQWASPEGIIPVNGTDNLLPRQIGGSNADLSAYRLLEMELRLFDQTAGVSSALLGGTANNAGTSGAEHYRAQVENATIVLADILSTFRDLVARRDLKLSETGSKSKPH